MANSIYYLNFPYFNQGYNMKPSDRQGINNSVLTYHRIVEAFKFAYAYRALLGDEDFANVTEVTWVFPRENSN